MSKLDNRYLIAGVAVGAAALTIHGSAHAAVLAGVPEPWAYIYPAILDGLAVVAWRATGSAVTWRRRFARTVMVGAAAASGLAQGYALATSGPAERPDVLAWGMGIAPALIVLIATILGADPERAPVAEDEGEPTPAEIPVEPAPIRLPAPPPVVEPAELAPAAVVGWVDSAVDDAPLVMTPAEVLTRQREAVVSAPSVASPDVTPEAASPVKSGRPSREQSRSDALAGRAWLAAERQAGRDPSGTDVARTIGREPRWGQRLLEAVEREEAASAARREAGAVEPQALRAVR